MEETYEKEKKESAAKWTSTRNYPPWRAQAWNPAYKTDEEIAYWQGRRAELPAARGTEGAARVQGDTVGTFV